MRTPRRTRQMLALGGAGLLLFGATACGSGSNSPQAQSYPGSGTQNQGSQNQNGQAQGRFPGANGQVAAVSGSTAQVQSQLSGQVAVTWTGSTSFTKQVSTTLAAVRTGVCVMVEPTSASASSASPGAMPTTVTAAHVRITAKTNGSCTPTFRGGGTGPQTQGNGAQGLPPGGAAPEGGTVPGGGTGRTQFRGFGAFGEVTAVSGTGFTVATTVPNGSSTSTTRVTVTVAKSTTYTTTAKGSATDVKVGVCLRAEGTTDNTGAVTARTIAVSPSTGGQCGMVFSRNVAPGAGTQVS